MTSVAIGRISALRSDSGEVPGGIADTAGRMWKTFTENTITSAIATTNSGSAVIVSAITEAMWSNSLSRRAAAISPRTPAMSVPIIPAPITSTAEFSSRGPISEDTFSPFASEVPKLPCKTPPIQLPYWLVSGRLRCSCASSACNRCGVALCPSTA